MKLHDDNQKLYDQAKTYLHILSAEDQDILDEIEDLLLSAQTDGLDSSDVIGDDILSFCDQMLLDVSDESRINDIYGYTMIFSIFLIFVPLLYKLLSVLSFSNAFTFKLLPIQSLIMTILILGQQYVIAALFKRSKTRPTMYRHFSNVIGTVGFILMSMLHEYIYDFNINYVYGFIVILLLNFIVVVVYLLFGRRLTSKTMSKESLLKVRTVRENRILKRNPHVSQEKLNVKMCNNAKRENLIWTIFIFIFIIEILVLINVNNFNIHFGLVVAILLSIIFIIVLLSAIDGNNELIQLIKSKDVDVDQ